MQNNKTSFFKPCIGWKINVSSSQIWMILMITLDNVKTPNELFSPKLYKNNVTTSFEQSHYQTTLK